MRVVGHSLEAEGAAFVPETWRNNSRWKRVQDDTISGHGHGRCSCGAVSPFLYNGQQRKDWHLAHKKRVAEVLESDITEDEE